MNLRLHELVIHCKHAQEVLPFTDFNYFHGGMGAGKSTIARLVDFCLGGDLVSTPALQAEFVAAALDLTIGSHRLLLTRDQGENKVRAQWDQNNEPLDIPVPAKQANGEVLPNTGVENLSDLFFYLSGIESPMVRRSKVKEESQLVRLSFRDLLWYCYLDQDSMDSSFFRLDDSNYAIRQKSLDVLRLIVGFHQQRISELQVRLEGIHIARQGLEAAAEALRHALSEDDLGSVDEIESAIEKASAEQTQIEEELKEIRAGLRHATTHATELLRDVCRQLADEVGDIGIRIREIETAIQNDTSHRNTLLNLAVRQRRAHGAKEALSGVQFSHCPECYQALPGRRGDVCPVCGQVHTELPSTPIEDTALEADVRARGGRTQ